MLDTFRKADEVLFHAVRGISDLITVHGLINLDFADVRTIMSGQGLALMGTGEAGGENRAINAAKQAISSPLLEEVALNGAKGVLINITSGSGLTLFEVNEASSIIQEEAHEDANIIFGAVIDENLDDTVRVTVIATGFESQTVHSIPAEAGGRDQLPIQQPNLAGTPHPHAFSARTKNIVQPQEPGKPMRMNVPATDCANESRVQSIPYSV